MLEKTLKSPLDCTEIKPLNPKGNQSWKDTFQYSLEGHLPIFTGRTDAKLKLQYFGHLMWRTDWLEKTLMLEKIEGRSRRGQQRMPGSSIHGIFQARVLEWGAIAFSIPVQEREAILHKEIFVTLAKGKFMSCFRQKGRGSVSLPLAQNSNPHTQMAYFGVIFWFPSELSHVPVCWHISLVICWFRRLFPYQVPTSSSVKISWKQHGGLL